MDASSNLSARQQPTRREHGRIHEDAETMDEDPFFPDAPRSELAIPKKVRKFTNKHKKPVIVAVITIVVLSAVAIIVGLMGSGIAGVDASRYQAVFLSDGTVYVGKLSAIDGAHYKLTSVYLVTSNQAAVASDKSAQSVTATTALTRLENGLLGAENEMTIQRDKVLFYENLKTDGTAAKLIANDQK